MQHLLSIEVLVTVIGLVLYLITAPPKVTEVGRIAFFCGLLATLLTIGRSNPFG